MPKPPTTAFEQTTEGQRMVAARPFEPAVPGDTGFRAARGGAEAAIGAEAATANWRLWGTYLSDRQWGTVREDYSPFGTAWDYLPHDHARSRAYRWGEDGLAGFCDLNQRVCFALALWNGADPILKERPFGLTNGEGNHGEDVKEYYFYLDNTPTHSYAKWLYKYPQRAFPYADLVAENARRKANPRAFEYELLDTGIFAESRYFDVQVEYAKASPADVAVRIQVTNCGPDDASIQVLPTLWFRNTWSWSPNAPKPSLRAVPGPTGRTAVVRCSELDELGEVRLYCDGAPELLFTENETNNQRLFGSPNASPFTKDAFDRYVVHGEQGAVNPARVGTKAAAQYELTVPAGQTATLRLRFATAELADPFGAAFDQTFTARRAEADAFYAAVNPVAPAPEQLALQRQAYAGMLWCKQLFYYVVADWLDGDPAGPRPPDSRLTGRNSAWRHYYSQDVLSMPDTWEYPWFAAWDSAFHVIVLATIDPEDAKRQLRVLALQWQMSPDGQIPAYEWAFGDVNPPLHAWAAYRVYKIDAKRTGVADRAFLKVVFDRCMLYFTWWLNRKDPAGRNLFTGGFLGMDNIGPFDRNRVPSGYELLQADGTGWMGMFALVMLKISIELAQDDPDYYGLAMKFFQNYVFIGDAFNTYTARAGQGPGLWDEADGFFYDALRPVGGGPLMPLKVRSFTGLVALFAIETIDEQAFADADRADPDFRARFDWFVGRYPDVVGQFVKTQAAGGKVAVAFEGDTARLGVSLVGEERLRRILRRVLDENEFFGPHGIRSVSRAYAGAGAYHQQVDGITYDLEYVPAESINGDFGGNSNWRGPVWFPVNYLLIESLQKYHHWLGPNFRVECPTGSGTMMNLWEVAAEISRRLVSTFERDAAGRRPVYGGTEVFQSDPRWRDYVLFFEYFHGDNGAGLGASHQTGWTGVTAKLIQQMAEHTAAPR